MVYIDVMTLPHAEGLRIPFYASRGASGMDLQAAIDADVTIPSGERRLVPTGICFAIPEGMEGQVRSRSGLAAKNGVIVLNTPGTIDSDYRGEIVVILANLGSDAFTVQRGMRIAQIVFADVVRVGLEQKVALDGTERGSGAFGSTGLTTPTDAAGVS